MKQHRENSHSLGSIGGGIRSILAIEAGKRPDQVVWSPLRERLVGHEWCHIASGLIVCPIHRRVI